MNPSSLCISYQEQYILTRVILHKELGTHYVPNLWRLSRNSSCSFLYTHDICENSSKGKKEERQGMKRKEVQQKVDIRPREKVKRI